MVLDGENEIVTAEIAKSRDFGSATRTAKAFITLSKGEGKRGETFAEGEAGNFNIKFRHDFCFPRIPRILRIEHG